MSFKTMKSLSIFLALVSSVLFLGSGEVHGIVGGSQADPNEFPFQAGLYYNDRLICGCTVLNTDYVLTAGHCAYNYEISNFTVYAGSHLLSAASHHGVVQITLHENFSSSASYPNDLAILQVNPPFVLSESLQPVKLVTQGVEYDSGTPSVAIGWGMTQSGSAYPDELQKVDLNVYSDVECRIAYFTGPEEYNICAGGPRGVGNIGTCGGDTGSALLINGEQVGISSWQRVPCGVADFPAVFTQVSLFIDWITSNAQLEE